jgi:hypothetical protein
MGRGPPGPRSTMDRPPLPVEGAHWSQPMAILGPWDDDQG